MCNDMRRPPLLMLNFEYRPPIKLAGSARPVAVRQFSEMPPSSIAAVEINRLSAWKSKRCGSFEMPSRREWAKGGVFCCHRAISSFPILHCPSSLNELCAIGASFTKNPDLSKKPRLPYIFKHSPTPIWRVAQATTAAPQLPQPANPSVQLAPKEPVR